MSQGPTPPKAGQRWTVRSLLEWTTPFLAKKGVDKPDREARILLAHALGWKPIELYTRHDEEAPEGARQRYRELILRLTEGTPRAYLVGYKDFYSLDFEVSPAVLIPRDDSVWVVEECLRLAKEVPAPEVLDVGTGSGCLAVAVAKRHRAARVMAVDISPEALAVAARNAARHGVADRVAFLEGDLFAPLPPGLAFDFVISNPPYVARHELEQLDRSVRDFEPRLALDGGPDGFAIFDRLVAQAAGYLKPGGHLIVEIGYAQEEAARQRVGGRPEYELGKTIHDHAGHPRVVCARRRP